jgi:protein SCO1/2
MPSALRKKKNSAGRGDEKFFLIIVLVLAVIAGVGSWFAAAALKRHDETKIIAPDKPRRLENFTLTDENGNTVARADVRGKILAVSFLFTSCSLTCPEVSKRMAEIQKLTATNEYVRLLSLTVDPRTDTPAVLAKWGSRFSAETNRWFLLTGDKAQLHWLIGTSFLATETNNPFNSMPGNFAGTERIAVVDKHGNVRAFFDGLRTETPRAVVAKMDELRNEP